VAFRVGRVRVSSKDAAKLTIRERIKFATEKPSSKDFGKSRADWKVSKDAANKGK
jgi:hypothetical protein